MEEIKINDKEYILKKEYDKLKSPEVKDFKIIEPCNVMCIVQVTEEKENFKVSVKDWEFPKENKCKVLQDLNNKDQIELFVKDERMGKITTEFYEQAQKVTKLWNKANKREEFNVYVMDKDMPVLLTDGSTLGFVLAPRINED